VGDLATKIARTEFVPKGLQGNLAGVAAAILTGREMGLGPMASLRGIHIVEGRASLTAEMLAARILAAGHDIRWVASTDQRATVKIVRADGLSEAESTFTMADAQRAGLAGKKVWQQYPRHMLRHRALTEAASMACPDVALGLDVGMSSLDEPEVRQSNAPTVVQIAQEAPDEPITAELVEVVAPEIPDATEALCTGAQLRKIGALVGQWETIEGRKLDRDERRRLIGFYAGVDDPDALETAKELTLSQASTAIEALQDVILAADDAVEAEVVEDHPDTLIP
jgi:hypothetical protein